MSHKDPTARRAYQRTWRRKNRAAYNASQRAYNKKRRKQKGEALQRKHLRHWRKWRYGVTQDQFDSVFAAQGYRCGVCRSTEHRGRGWCQDHNHATSKPRGVLCTPCNLALGYMRDDPIVADAAAAYLRRHA